MKFSPTLILAPVLAITAANPAFATEEEGEEEGVPHVVVGALNDALTLDFEIVEPTPGLTGPGGTDLITLFLPSAQGQLAIPPSPLSGNVFASNPVSGLDSGFINDDTGFESEDLPTGADINIRLTSVDLASDVDFFFLFGSTVLSSADLDLTGSGLTQVDTAAAVGLPGDSAFDFHPTFTLISSLADPADVEGTFVFELTDSGAGLAPTSFALRLTADSAAAIVPEPATAGLLTLGGLTLAVRRRRA